MTSRRALAAGAVLMATSLWPSAGGAQNLVDLVSRITPSVAYIVAMGSDEHPQASGTAFLAAPGALVTALHVVEAASRVSVQLPAQPAIDVDVIGIDTAHDLAVLHAAGLTSPGPAPLPLGTSSTVQLGEPVTVIGYPLASPERPSVSVTHGIVSSIATDPAAVQIDAPINPGNSGGPVVGADGRVIGVVDASLRGAQNVNFAVPIDFVKALIVRAAGRPPLPLPLTAPAEIVLKGSGGGLGPYEHDEKEGAVCLAPPPHAAVLTGLRVELHVQPPLHLLAWLSWEHGVAPESSGAFGLIDDSVHAQLVTPVTGLDLPPRTLCLNYLAVNATSGRARGTFTVTYTINFRVFTVPDISRRSPMSASKRTHPRREDRSTYAIRLRSDATWVRANVDRQD